MQATLPKQLTLQAQLALDVEPKLTERRAETTLNVAALFSSAPLRGVACLSPEERAPLFQEHVA
jgi:hypothetical protein